MLRAQVEDVLVALRRRLFDGISEDDLQACLRVSEALKAALAAPPARRRTTGHEAAGAAQCPRSRVLAQELRGRDAGALSVVQHGPAASVLGHDHGLHRVAALVRRGALQGAVPAGRHFRRLGHDGVHGAAPVQLARGDDRRHGPVGRRLLRQMVLDRTPRSHSVHAGRLHRRHDRCPSPSPRWCSTPALARVEEIALGIVCATLVHSVVLPRGRRRR